LAHSKAELLSLQQVRCFAAAVELGSFTAAAAELRVSQPAVADQIRKLERALGADLFVRAGRGVVPTDAGYAFARHAADTLRSLEDAAESVSALTSLRGRQRRVRDRSTPPPPGVCTRWSRRSCAATRR
jgi:DNA-binding transcriptional LysR family regulator